LAFPVARADVGDKLGEGFGDGAGDGAAAFAGAAAGSAVLGAVAAVAGELAFVSEPSLVPPNTGATNTRATTELQSQLFRFISYVVLHDREPFIEVDKRESLLSRACGHVLGQVIIKAVSPSFVCGIGNRLELYTDFERLQHF